MTQRLTKHERKESEGSGSISLLISICNGLIQLLSLNKQYTSYIVEEKSSIRGTKYLNFVRTIQETHKNNYTRFCEGFKGY